MDPAPSDDLPSSNAASSGVGSRAQPLSEPEGAIQLSLFDGMDFDPGVAVDIIPVEEEIRWTKDITSLADVPVSSPANVQLIEVVKRGIGGEEHRTLEPGKVILRRAPHPDFVRVKGRVLPRDELNERERHLASPIMVETVTTIIYGGGIVAPFHLDVLHALLHLLLERWQATGRGMEPLRTTRTEILKAINATKTGKSSRQIDEALNTLQGLKITKTYNPQQGNQGDAECPSTRHQMGGIIANFKIHDRKGNSAKGSPDIIEVDLNPAIIQAMMTGADHRQWSLRTLNLTKTIRITEHWKRQLYRLLDSRFQQTGYLNIPAKELWVGCLGRDDGDASNPSRWRMARFKLRQAFSEFEATGYLQDFTFISKHRPTSKTTSDQRMQIELDGGESAQITASASYELDGDMEWIRCQPGPAFFAEGPRRAKDFAIDLVEALLAHRPQERQDQYRDLVLGCGPDAIMEATAVKVKDMAVELGDLYRRLPQTGWLSPTYPLAPIPFIINKFMAEYDRHANAAVLGDAAKKVSPPYFEHRMAVITRRLLGRLYEKQLTPMVLLEGANVPVEFAEAKELHQMVLSAIFRRLQLDDKALDPLIRATRPDFEKEFRSGAVIASVVAPKVAAMILWQRKIQDQVADRLREVRTEDPYVFLYRRDLSYYRTSAPKTVKFIQSCEDRRSVATTSLEDIENEMAKRLRARLVEHRIESQTLVEVERKGVSPQ